MEIISTALPLWYQISLVAGLGLIIGSFLNVVIIRLHTGRSLRGRSHCMSCGRTLNWYELLPVFSYLSQSGRCRNCDAFIPIRYLVIELSTATLFILAFWQSTNWLELITWFALLSVLVVIFFYDLDHLIIPNELVILASVLALLLGLSTGLFGNWSAIYYGLLGGFGLAGFFALLWIVSAGRWIGLGDAKLALPLGFVVGAAGAFSLAVLAFWIGALISLGLLWLGRGKVSLPKPFPRLTMKSEVPFAPFLIIAFLAVSLFSIDVLEIVMFKF